MSPIIDLYLRKGVIGEKGVAVAGAVAGVAEYLRLLFSVAFLHFLITGPLSPIFARL